VRLVIADTGPVNYLILIRNIDLLPRMFERVIVPGAVRNELASADAPPAVREWIASAPDWLEIIETPESTAPAGLHRGEAEAIDLAESLRADLLLMDERKGVNVARARHIRVTGTLGLLEMAAQRGLVDFADSVARLRQTSFRSPDALLDLMLRRNKKQ
jgi:predicted nucleic acid-binding protein